MSFDLGSVLSLLTRLSMLSTSDRGSVASMNLFVALLCACIVIGHLLEKNRWMNESVTALALGLCSGVVILLTTGGRSSRLLVFSQDLFFTYLLPPIIFNAGSTNDQMIVPECLLIAMMIPATSAITTLDGYGFIQLHEVGQRNMISSINSPNLVKELFLFRFQVKKKNFFHNFMTIMLFGAVGTLISFVIIAQAQAWREKLGGWISYTDFIAWGILGATQLFKKLEIGSLEIGDYLAIGAIFSATDSVCTLQVLNEDETPLLYSLVFGEGVVNDAMSVVLFNAIQRFDLTHIDTSIALQLVGNFSYLFITSTVLGVFAGLFSAYIIKTLYFGRHSTDREVALMMLMAYLSYILAELFSLSAILTVFFCGIVMSHYTWHNVTESSRITTKHAFATLSFIAEIFIFLYVGMDALDIEKWTFVRESPGKFVGASSMLVGLILIGRAAFVFPLSFLSNLVKKSPNEKIGVKKQVTIWWAGLMRGAVSIALAYNQFTSSGHTQLRANAILITSTITVVLFTTVVFGLMTKPLVRFLLPPQKHLSGIVSSEPSSPKSFTIPLLVNVQDSETGLVDYNVHRPTSLRMLLTTPTHTVHYYWRKFDDAIMRPVFGGRGFVPFVPGSPIECRVHQRQ